MKNLFRQTGKALLSMLVVPFMLLSCYDDSAIWQSMHELENSLNELKAQLEGQAEAMSALLTDGSTIKSCVKQNDGSYLITLSNENITLSTLRKVSADTYMVRLINNYSKPADCTCTVFDKTMNLSFGKYEVKTLLYKDGELKEHDSMLNL